VTLTEMRRIARQARRYGYLCSRMGMLHGSTLTVTCPRCRARVSIEFSQYAYDGSVPRTLDAAMLAHLEYDECTPQAGAA
jgi:hypothetical protein